MIAEVWKPVVGFENHYVISNLGTVKRTSPSRFKDSVGKTIKPYWNLKPGARYPTIHLRGPKPRKTLDAVRDDVVRRRREGLLYTQIAAEFSISLERVWRFCKLAGLCREPLDHRRKDAKLLTSPETQNL